MGFFFEFMILPAHSIGPCVAIFVIVRGVFTGLLYFFFNLLIRLGHALRFSSFYAEFYRVSPFFFFFFFFFLVFVFTNVMGLGLVFFYFFGFFSFLSLFFFFFFFFFPVTVGTNVNVSSLDIM